MKKGKVILAGAGPGDPDLITVRLAAYLQQADIVLADYLAPVELKKRTSPKCRWINVGKQGMKERARNTKQTLINQMMRRFAREGKWVLRLKGGDPFVFGRGGEECEYLAKNRISFEIIPGIVSMGSAGLFAGIPLTHRDHSKSFAVLTGHLREGLSPEEIRIPQVDTLIIGMILKNFDKLIGKIIDAGWKKATPVAIIQSASLPSQRVYRSTLARISRDFNRLDIKSPATLIVGKVVGLHEKIKWFNQGPLAGKRIVLTRPREQSEEMALLLSSLGALVHLCPMIKICASKAGQNDYFKKNAFATITDIIFTSPNTVTLFFERLLAKRLDARTLASVKVFAIGKSTAERLRGFGLNPDHSALRASSEGLIELLPKDLQEREFLLPSGNMARRLIANEIKRRGGRVQRLVLYDTRPELAGALPKEDEMDAICFASPSAFKNFIRRAGRIPPKVEIFALGPLTAGIIRNTIHRHVHFPADTTAMGLVEKIVKEIGQKVKKK